MIRGQLKKLGLWAFILCLIGFIGANYRLNSLEKSRRDHQAAAEKIFAPVADSGAIKKIIIQNDLDFAISRLDISILPEKHQLEYQPQFHNITYEFIRENDELRVKIRTEKPKGRRAEFPYPSAELHLPAHITSIRLERFKGSINFPKDVQLSEVELVTLKSDIDITNINATRLTLRDQYSGDPEEKHIKEIEFFGYNAITHLEARLSNTALSLLNIDIQPIQSLILDLSDKATLNAKAQTLQKITWRTSSGDHKGAAH